MDRARFEAIIAAYGAEPRRWPEGERAAAEQFYAENRGDVADAMALDAALDGLGQSYDPALLTARIMKQQRGLRGAPAPGARWALAACALVGIAIGFGVGATGATAATAEPGQILGAALEAPYDVAEDSGG